MTETTHEALVRQTAAAEALLAYFQGQRDGLQADIGTAQAAYAALSLNLKGVIANEMSFIGTIDPNAVATNVRGGIFNTIHDFVNAAPVGAYLLGQIPGDVTIEVNQSFTLHNQFLELVKLGGVDRPLVRFNCVVFNGTHNGLHVVDGRGNWGFRCQDIDIDIAGKVDAALPWAWRKSVFTANANASSGFLPVALNKCDVSGADGNALVTVHAGGLCSLSLMDANFAGDMFTVTGWGKVISSEYVVGLSGGAAMLDTATSTAYV